MWLLCLGGCDYGCRGAVLEAITAIIAPPLNDEAEQIIDHDRRPFSLCISSEVTKVKFQCVMYNHK